MVQEEFEVTNRGFKLGNATNRRCCVELVTICDLKIGSGRHRKYLPYAFAEHGAIMALHFSLQPLAFSLFFSSSAG